MSNKLFNDIDLDIKSGKRAFILEWNTNDRQIDLDNNIFPTSLHLSLAIYFGNRGYHCGLYSQGLGLMPLNPPNMTAEGKNPFQNQNGNALSHLTPVLRQRDNRCVLIVQYADLLAPSSEGSVFLQPEQQVVLETLHRWGADDAIRQAQTIIILISYESTVNSLLTNSGVYQRIQVPLPTESERSEFIVHLLGNDSSNSAKIEDGLSNKELIRITNGLRLRDLEALFHYRRDTSITRKDIQSIKSNTIHEMAGGLVEVVKPLEDFGSIAGLSSVKAYFQFLKWIFQNGSPTVPYALILAGVPGTGKSKLCGTLAKELDLPLLVLRNLYGAYVGQSEANLERVLRVVETMSPCVILIEEIDQGIGQRGTGHSGDSGTSNRMSQRFWEYLGSSEKNRGKNIWIGTSNRPDLLDAAMIDRFQVVIPFLHPTPAEVAQLLPQLASQLNRKFSEDIDLNSVVELPSLYLPTVRGLNEVVSVAAQRADYKARRIGMPITQKDLMNAALDFKPTYDRLQHEYIALKAVSMVSFSSLLPWMTIDGYDQNIEIPDYLENIVDAKSGYLNSSTLNDKIRNLEQQLYSQKVMR